MGAYEINKISLSVFDDKSFVLNDGIHTLAYFHKGINSHKRQRLQNVLTKRRDSHRYERFKKILIKRRDSHR